MAWFHAQNSSRSGGRPLNYLSRASSWTISDDGHLERTPDGHVILPEGDDLYFDVPSHPADASLFPSLFSDESFVWRAERDRGIREWESAQSNPEVFDALLKVSWHVVIEFHSLVSLSS